MLIGVQAAFDRFPSRQRNGTNAHCSAQPIKAEGERDWTERENCDRAIATWNKLTFSTSLKLAVIKERECSDYIPHEP